MLKHTHQQQKRKRTQINKIRNERGEITTYIHKIQQIVRKCYESDNMDEMKWINSQKHNLPKLNEEESENLNRQTISSETEAVIKKLPTNRSPGLGDFMGEFTKHSKKN